MRRGVGIELVEVSHAHGEVGVGEELDGLCLGTVAEQHRDILLDSPFLQQPGEGLGPLRMLAEDNARGMQVVVERPAFAQEVGREDQVASA